jgi:hypothetical protein
MEPMNDLGVKKTEDLMNRYTYKNRRSKRFRSVLKPEQLPVHAAVKAGSDRLNRELLPGSLGMRIKP